MAMIVKDDFIKKKIGKNFGNFGIQLTARDHKQV